MNNMLQAFICKQGALLHFLSDVLLFIRNSQILQPFLDNARNRITKRTAYAAGTTFRQ